MPVWEGRGLQRPGAFSVKWASLLSSPRQYAFYDSQCGVIKFLQFFSINISTGEKMQIFMTFERMYLFSPFNGHQQSMWQFNLQGVMKEKQKCSDGEAVVFGRAPSNGIFHQWGLLWGCFPCYHSHHSHGCQVSWDADSENGRGEASLLRGWHLMGQSRGQWKQAS